MDNIGNNEISNIILVAIIIMIAILMILSMIYLVLVVKSRAKPKKSEKDKGKKGTSKTPTTSGYSKGMIFDFMEFDRVEDNMIIKIDGKKYLMVVECQGVNYDLMSRIEKTSVEEGFQQFLNTLRHPIQIYIQTRTINLENSISTYKKKVDEIEQKYERMKSEYQQMQDEGIYSQEQLDRYYYELTKQRNLYEYAKDIVYNTEKMSLNRNVLNKKYYIVIPYYVEEVGNNQYDKEEIKNMAFSELYTKAQAVVRTLSACSVSGKILTSDELVDLLYVAYNRDESEVFGIDKAKKASYEDLYSTSQDVFDKKLKELDKYINESAIALANEKIEKVKSEKQRLAEEREKQLVELVGEMAERILAENEDYVGKDVAEEAIEEIKKERKGGKKDEQEKKTTRGRRKKTTTE